MNSAAHRLQSRAHALAFLRTAGASSRLLRHAELVADVAAELATTIKQLGVGIDGQIVELGAVLHDAGKIVFPAELTEPGRSHEAAGEKLLIDHGVSSDLARFCRTHGLPASEMPAIEDLVVAVADHLWRGTRNQQLESALIESLVQPRPGDRWAVFSALDDCFERIAEFADQRLARQQDPRGHDASP